MTDEVPTFTNLRFAATHAAYRGRLGAGISNDELAYMQRDPLLRGVATLLVDIARQADGDYVTPIVLKDRTTDSERLALAVQRAAQENRLR